MNMRIDFLLMEKHMPQGVKEIIHDEEHGKGRNHIRPSEILGIPQKVGIPVNVHESSQNERPVRNFVPKQKHFVFLSQLIQMVPTHWQGIGVNPFYIMGQLR